MFFILLLLLRVPFLSNVNHGIQAFFARAGTGVGESIQSITKQNTEVAKERDYYQNLAAKLAIEQSQLEQLTRDVQEMQSLLDYTQTAPYKAVAARVIARSDKGAHTMLLDKGEVDGVRPRLAVVVENGHMIGFIDSVRKNSSTVVLLQHEISRIPSMIIGTNETIGLVEGQGGFLLHMQFIPQRIVLESSDIVVTSGLDGVFPKGLVLGSIESIEKDVTAAFQEAFVQPFYDSAVFTNVLILDPFQEVL